MLRHPYHEDCVVLPTRPTLRPDNKNIERDIVNRLLRDDTSLSRWSPAIATGRGCTLAKLVNARNYFFPKPLVVPCTWIYAPRALSLSDAVNSVSQHEHHESAW